MDFRLLSEKGNEFAKVAIHRIEKTGTANAQGKAGTGIAEQLGSGARGYCGSTFSSCAAINSGKEDGVRIP
jgi:hypothetical protein